MKPIGSLVSLVVAFVLAGQSPAVAAQLASKEDAVVSSTDTGWVVANALVTYAVGFDANGDLVVQDLRRTGDTHSWRPSPVRDTVFRIDDRELGLTRSNAAGFRHTGADVADVGTGLELRLTFEDLRDGLRARRVYAIYPQVAVIEAWTELESINGRSTTVTDLVSLQLVVDGALATTVDGLSGPAETGGSFAVRHQVIAEDTPLVLEEHGRSTQRSLPLVTLASARGTLVSGLMWSGAWRMDLVGKPGGRTELTAWLANTTTAVTPTRPVTMPHAIVGVVEGDEGRVAPALHRFIVGALRGGRLLEPLVTYNTWFSSGANIDEESIEEAMRAAAAAGAELFELDAGLVRGRRRGGPLRLRLGARLVARRQGEVPARPAGARRPRARPGHEVRNLGRAGARRPADRRRAGHGPRDVADAGERPLPARYSQRRGPHRQCSTSAIPTRASGRSRS